MYRFDESIDKNGRKKHAHFLEILKSAQYRKGLSISYFNSLNAAISLCVGMNIHEEATFKRIEEIRDLFLENYKNYYATVIANVGQNYKAEDSIKKLESVKSLEELKAVWLSASEDERRDSEIIKTKEEMKKKFLR